MKEQKIMTLTQPGYRLQLLKITETTVNGYYQIRENRKIKATFTTLDAAVRKFYALQRSKILQKNLFTEEKEEETTIKQYMKSIQIYKSTAGYRLFAEFNNPQDKNAIIIATMLNIPKNTEFTWQWKK